MVAHWPWSPGGSRVPAGHLLADASDRPANSALNKTQMKSRPHHALRRFGNNRARTFEIFFFLGNYEHLTRTYPSETMTNTQSSTIERPVTTKSALVVPEFPNTRPNTPLPRPRLGLSPAQRIRKPPRSMIWRARAEPVGFEPTHPHGRRFSRPVGVFRLCPARSQRVRIT